MTFSFDGHRLRVALTGLGLVAGLVVTPVGSHDRLASAADPVAWIQVGEDIDGEAAGDDAGWSAAMSSDGNTVVIGAPRNDGNGGFSGHARIYRVDGADWVQVGGDIDGSSESDWSGWSVAMSSDGNTVIIGAPRNDDNGDDAGQARVYRFDGTDWVQVGDDLGGEAAKDFFGASVAMSSDGNTVIIGAPETFQSGAGRAEVYSFDGNEWGPVGGDILGELRFDRFGWSVAMSDDGNTVIVGATDADDRVFHLDGNEWVQVGANIDGPYGSGASVAMSSDGATIIIGTPNRGPTRVHQFGGGEWVQVGGDIDGDGTFDEAGTSVAMSGDGTTIVIGAPRSDGIGEQSGRARVYRFDGSDWDQVGEDIDGEAPYDGAGYSVAMSSDGSTVIVGARDNDGNGRSSGHARVFVAGAPPPLVCGDIAGTADELAAAGYNVVVGTNGPDFLPGTPGNDFIMGLDGKDVILAGLGDDLVCAGSSHDVVVGGGGSDQLHGDSGNDRIWGGTEDDLITGGAGKDLLIGGNGDDDVSGDGADDTIRGGRDDDVLRGGAGKDDIRGDAGNDMLFGDGADDVLRGHAGVDVCDGGAHVNGDQAFSCETLIDIP